MNGMLGSKGIFILVSLIIVLLIVDTSIVKISALIGGLASPTSSVAIFTAMAIMSSVGQYLILSYIRTRIHETSAQYGSKLLKWTIQISSDIPICFDSNSWGSDPANGIYVKL